MDGTQLADLMIEGLVNGFIQAIPIILPIILAGFAIIILKIILKKRKK